MDTGMMWQSKKDLTERVQEAAKRFREKYHVEPDTAFVNAALLTGKQTVVNGVEIKPMRIPLNLLWIGVEHAARDLDRESRELVERASEFHQTEMNL